MTDLTYKIALTNLKDETVKEEDIRKISKDYINRLFASVILSLLRNKSYSEIMQTAYYLMQNFSLNPLKTEQEFDQELNTLKPRLLSVISRLLIDEEYLLEVIVEAIKKEDLTDQTEIETYIHSYLNKMRSQITTYQRKVDTFKSKI